MGHNPYLGLREAESMRGDIRSTLAIYAMDHLT